MTPAQREELDKLCDGLRRGLDEGRIDDGWQDVLAALALCLAEIDGSRRRAHRQARIWEPSADCYKAAMSVYTAAFGKSEGEPEIVLSDGSTKQGWEL